MLGFFSKLARAPWWIFAVLAAIAGYFGFVAGGFSIGGYEPKPLAMLVSAIPQLEPAIAWLESMGLDRNQGFGLPFGGGTAGAGMPMGLDDTPSVASRIQIFAGLFALVAVYKLLFGAPRTRKQAGSVLDDPRVMQAILKDAPGKISDEAWENPLAVAADTAQPTHAHAQPAPRSQPGPSAATKPRSAKRAGFFRRSQSSRESRADRRAREEAVRAKLAADPFEKLLRDSH
ncbi:MAG: hypothetical protein AAF092_14015 [Pseudomonadota bacterium]